MNDTKFFQKKFIRLLGVTILILVAEVGILVFLFQSVREHVDFSLEQQSLLQSLQQEASSYEQLENDFKRLTPVFSAFEGALPDEEGLFRVVGALENAGAKNGVRVSLRLESQTLLPTDYEGVRSVPFSASLDGSYSTLRRYLHDVEALPIWVHINEISFRGSGSILEGGTVTLKGDIFTQ